LNLEYHIYRGHCYSDAEQWRQSAGKETLKGAARGDCAGRWERSRGEIESSEAAADCAQGWPGEGEGSGVIEPWGLRLRLQWKWTNYRQQHLVWIGPDISVGRIQKAEGWPKFQCTIKRSVTRGGLLFIGERAMEHAARRLVELRARVQIRKHRSYYH
jgi:hypothetical protein